jgi:hypothetical protein
MGDLLQPAHLMVIAIVLGLPALVFLVPPFWFILKKAGFAPQLTFLNLFPFGLGTLILIYLLAFADWKMMPGQPPPYPPHT